MKTMAAVICSIGRLFFVTYTAAVRVCVNRLFSRPTVEARIFIVSVMRGFLPHKKSDNIK